MTQKEVVDELKGLTVERLRFDPRFGIVIDDGHDLTAEFRSLDSLSRFILAKTGQA